MSHITPPTNKPVPDSLKPSQDERGFTLQTLIVTAVLVLMAVAAGVVIVAITTNAAEDLEDQSSDIIGACEPWEIRDPRLEALGIGGGNGGIVSSAIGCLRVCYITSASQTGSTGEVNGLFTYSREIPTSGATVVVTDANDRLGSGGRFAIRVSASQDRCEVVDTITGRVTDLSDVS